MHVTIPQHQRGPALSRLREAKDLAADRDSPFAEFPLSEANGLRVTLCDCSCTLTKYSGHIVGADLSRTPPIYRPSR